MVLRWLATGILLLPLQAMAALYDFADQTTYLAPADQMQAWQDVLDKHQRQRHDLLACVYIT